MGLTPLTKDELAELKPYGFQQSTPLWYYALKEAQLYGNGGQHLGPRRRPDRCRGSDRPAPIRSERLPRQQSELAADAPESGLGLADDQLPHLRRRRSGNPAQPTAELRLIGPTLGGLGLGRKRPSVARAKLDPSRELTLRADIFRVHPEPPRHRPVSHHGDAGLRRRDELVRLRRIDPHQDSPLAARGNRHVAADEEGEPAEHLLLG